MSIVNKYWRPRVRQATAAQECGVDFVGVARDPGGAGEEGRREAEERRRRRRERRGGGERRMRD